MTERKWQNKQYGFCLFVINIAHITNKHVTMNTLYCINALFKLVIYNLLNS